LSGNIVFFFAIQNSLENNWPGVNAETIFLFPGNAA
jgi:hypothetical protein